MSDLPIQTIYKMKDDAENVRVHKQTLFDLPMRLLIIGKAQLSGKTNCIGNLLLRAFSEKDTEGSQFYKNDFDGDNIYIVCPSIVVDDKWQSIIKGKQIPKGNIYDKYDEEELEALYDKLEADYYANAAKGKHQHVLVVFDDCSFAGSLKSRLHGVMSKFACNSRQFLVSVIVTSQKFSDVSTSLCENASGLILYACSQKQMELIYNDVGEQTKKEFMAMFRKATHERHSFMVVNYSNDPEHRFLDSHFQALA